VRTTWEGQPLVLARTRTYMNASGEAAAALLRRTGSPPQRLMVICDDMDRPMGSLRLRSNGGSGGQNGMKSIIAHLKTEDFPRLRLGVGRPYPPEDRPVRDREQFERDMIRWLLTPFSKEDEKLAGPMRERAVEALHCYLTDGIERAMNAYN
jgi:PTH1 family peptidyl-tRNA hydrolase